MVRRPVDDLTPRKQGRKQPGQRRIDRLPAGSRGSLDVGPVALPQQQPPQHLTAQRQRRTHGRARIEVQPPRRIECQRAALSVELEEQRRRPRDGFLNPLLQLRQQGGEQPGKVQHLPHGGGVSGQLEIPAAVLAEQVDEGVPVRQVADNLAGSRGGALPQEMPHHGIGRRGGGLVDGSSHTSACPPSIL